MCRGQALSPPVPTSLQERMARVTEAKHELHRARTAFAIDSSDADAAATVARLEREVSPQAMTELRAELLSDFGQLKQRHENDLATVAWNPWPDPHVVRAGQAKKNLERHGIELPDADLETRLHPGYVEGLGIEGIHFRRVRAQQHVANDLDLTPEEREHGA